MKGVSGKKLDEIYMSAWKLGMKTCYYLRTLAATQIEKSTLDATKYGFTQKRTYDSVNGNGIESDVLSDETYMAKTACNIVDTECESCQ